MVYNCADKQVLHSIVLIYKQNNTSVSLLTHLWVHTLSNLQPAAGLNCSSGKHDSTREIFLQHYSAVRRELDTKDAVLAQLFYPFILKGVGRSVLFGIFSFLSLTWWSPPVLFLHQDSKLELSANGNGKCLVLGLKIQAKTYRNQLKNI